MQTEPLDVSVVVPVYDNARTLEELCARLAGALDGAGLRYEVLLVDDGSRDDSWQVLRRLRAADTRLRPVRLARNFGQAAALCAGFERCRGRVVVTIDADLQNFPEDVPGLVAEVDKGHDLVSGYRVLREDPALLRRLPSKLFNRLVRRIAKVELRDIGCGLNAMDARLVREIGAHGEMRRFLKPLAALLADSPIEVPVQHAPPGDGSRYSLMSLIALHLDFVTSFTRRPFQVIWVAGLGGFALAFLAGLANVVLYVAFDVSLDVRVQSLIVLGMIFGLQLGILGLLGEFLVRSFHAQNQPFFVVREDPP